MPITPVQIEYDLSGIASPKMYILDPSGSSATALNNAGAGDAVTITTQGYHCYESEISENITGLQRVVILSGSTPIVDGWVYLADTTDRVYVEETVAGALAAANQTAVLAAIPSAADIEAALVNDGDATAFLTAVADKIAGDLTTGDVTAQAIATATRDLILDRILAGNHDTAGSAGKLIQDAATAGGDATSANQTAIISSLATIDTNVDTLLTRITSTLFSGMTSMAKWLTTLLFDGTPDATAKSEINALGSGDYDETIHSWQVSAIKAARAVALLESSSTPVTGTPNFYTGNLIEMIAGDSYGETTSGFDPIKIIDVNDIWYSGVTSDLMYFAVKPAAGNTTTTASVHVAAAHIVESGHKAAEIVLETAVTELLSGGNYNYHLYAVDSASEVKTLGIGKLVLQAKYWDNIVPTP